MTKTAYSRKLDSTGRLMIPIKLREQMGLVTGQEYSFFVLEEQGKRYICIECPVTETELAKAIELIEQSGMKVVSD